MALDLLSNTIIIPINIYIRTIVIPWLLRKKVVLVEEDLPGSLADYVHAALILGLLPIARISINMLFRLTSIGRKLYIVYLYCDKKLLSERWIKRGTPPEINSYLLVQDLVFKIWLKHINTKISVNTERDPEDGNNKIVKFIHNLCNTSDK